MNRRTSNYTLTVELPRGYDAQTYLLEMSDALHFVRTGQASFLKSETHEISVTFRTDSDRTAIRLAETALRKSYTEKFASELHTGFGVNRRTVAVQEARGFTSSGS